MIEKETPESGKIFALSLMLMNSLILTTIGGLFWIVQLILAQANQLNYNEPQN